MIVFSNRHIVGKSSPSLTAAYTPGESRIAAAHADFTKGKWSLRAVDADVTDDDALALLEPVFSADRPILLYVHGFNNTPNDVFDRARRLEERYGVTVVGFSWPAEGFLPDGTPLPGQTKSENESSGESSLLALLGNEANTSGSARKKDKYFQAKTNAMHSVKGLARFLRLVASVRLKVNRQRFSVAIHSLGNHLLQQCLSVDGTLEALAAAQNIILLAPCVRASGHLDWLSLMHPAGRVYVTFHNGDTVLAAARIADNNIKLGADPGVDYSLVRSVRYIDFTDSPVGAGAHTYFVDNRVGKRTRTLFARLFGSANDFEANYREVYFSIENNGVLCQIGRKEEEGPY